MNKKLTYILIGAAFLAGILYSFMMNAPRKEEVTTVADPRNASYMIDGRSIQLVDGVSEIEAVPGSASKIVTRYFGNEVRHDLNDDGREDVVFLITQDTGGTGTFFYVVAALNMPTGYIGSHGLLLGDRIAPQTTELSQNPNHKNVIVVNYADRKPGEPFTAAPSMGKSIWLRLDPATMQFGEVVQNFEGESAAALTEGQARTIAEKSCVKGGEALAAGIHNKNTQTWWFDANLNVTQPGCKPACVVSEVTETAEINWRCTGLAEPQQ
jgi:hypothetical protein